MQPTDEMLMSSFCAGQTDAFALLLSRYRGPLFNFIARWIGREQAEDLLQETWLRVLRSAATYRPKAKFKTWLYTLAHNVCIDEARRRAHRESLALEEKAGSAAPEGLADDGASPEEAAHGASLRPLLESALASLPSEQREVFWLREYGELAFKDIATVTGVSENTVKSRMRYALGTLRQKLAPLAGDDTSMRKVAG
jgi:RNA polymerase sigma-70 factor (ECF subfamily)